MFSYAIIANVFVDNWEVVGMAKLVSSRKWRYACTIFAFACGLAFAVAPAFASELDELDSQAQCLVTQNADVVGNDASAIESLDDDQRQNAGTVDFSQMPPISDESTEPIATEEPNVNVGEKADDAKVDENASLISQESSADKAAEEKPSYEETHTNMYRLYNPNSGEHFYTASMYEALNVASAGWRWEGIGWVAPRAGQPVYRLYNPNAGDHHYTMSAYERDHLVRVGWRYEGIGWYSDGKDQAAIYRQYNPNAKAGSHNFTASKAEDSHLGSVGWRREGVSWYATNGPTIKINGCWLITNAWGSMQRYWIGSDGNIVKGRFIKANEGTGYDVYATGSGAIARGKTSYNGTVLLSDNDGRLASGEGWLITGRYDGGAVQRYWLVKVSGDYSGAKTGLFTVGNSKYYGLPAQGYVVRNDYIYSGRWYKANNDGVLSESGAPGEAEMLLRAQGLASRTGYLVLVDTNACRMAVFSGAKGSWTTVRIEDCVCGAPGTPTIKGTYSLGYHLPVLPAWSNALYCTNITGGYFFHSVLSSTSELGKHLSHGCVRLNWPTAQYIQSLPTGSTVSLY